MRTIFLLLALTLLCLPLSAQNDTSFVVSTVEDAQITKPALMEARNQIFRLQEPGKTMFKFDLMGLMPTQIGRDKVQPQDNCINCGGWPGAQFRLGVERKITPAVAVNLAVSSSIYQDRFQELLSVHLEPRWYYGMSRRIKSGQQADNLSGNYLGLDFKYGVYNDGILANYRYKVFGASLNWGMQRRLFGWGFFDVGYGLGFARTPSTTFSRGSNYLYTQPRIQIGLAYVRPRHQTASGGYCEVLRCFREERSMWKVDILNAVDFYSDYRLKRFRVQPYVAFEQKVGTSAFSFQPSIQASYTRTSYDNELFDSDRIEWGGGEIAGMLQARWYFTMNRRIAQGRSGNNLSGVYLGLEGAGTYAQGKTRINGDQFNSNSTRLHSAVLAGLQYRFLRNGFVDCYLGLGPAIEYYDRQYTDGTNGKGRQTQWLDFTGGIKVGWAF